MDVYSIGECVIDFLPGPLPGSYLRNAGGAPANAAIALARNGLSVGFCGKVGDDDFGRFLQDTLTKNGVELLCPGRTGAAVTTMAFVTLTAAGERSFTFARKPGADMLLAPDEVREADLTRTTVVHGGSCSLSKGSAAAATEKALRQGHALGKLVSFDVNYRDLMWDGDRALASARIRDILPCVDLLKVSDEEAGMVGGEEHLPELARKYGISVLVETLGSKGARCWWQGEAIEVPGRAVTAVDTTGAGDAFWGGFLSWCLLFGVKRTDDFTGDLLVQALRYGNAAGGITVQRMGAIPALPTRQEVEAVLRAEGGWPD